MATIQIHAHCTMNAAILCNHGHGHHHCHRRHHHPHPHCPFSLVPRPWSVIHHHRHRHLAIGTGIGIGIVSVSAIVPRPSSIVIVLVIIMIIICRPLLVINVVTPALAALDKNAAQFGLRPTPASTRGKKQTDFGTRLFLDQKCGLERKMCFASHAWHCFSHAAL